MNVLFLCTGNSARSIMAEALLNHLGNSRFRAFSAGSTPTGLVNPLAISTLERHGIDVNNLRSKSWDEFAAADAVPMQYMITVCDRAAGEPCPVWPGRSATAHWSIEDPAGAEGFEDAFRDLEARIKQFVATT